MAELNLKQITDKLNSKFASDVRKLVFWYDANAEFVDDVDSLELDNAKSTKEGANVYFRNLPNYGFGASVGKESYDH